MNKFKVGEEVRLVSGARNIVNNLGDGNIYVVEDIKEDGIKLRGLFPYYHFSLFEIVEILKESNTKKFKVGDEVRLKDSITSIYLKHNKEYVVDKVFDDKLFVQGVDFKYNSNIFELVKESNMNKFKVGDKVVRTGLSVGKALQGGVYEISEVLPLISNRFGINLEGHEIDENTRFQYYSSGFELYVDDTLSPLEAAEALMNKDKLQVFDSDTNKWYGFHNELRNIALEDLRHIKLRHKPKTVVINGVEVVAPVELPRYTVGYTPSLCHREVQTASAGKGRIMWATEEDAQKALDAMLLPFDKLNKGVK